jgi:hypothetical protein
MIVFKLTHPWRWRIWLLCCPIWLPTALSACFGAWAAEWVVASCDGWLDKVESVAEWCKEHEYVEED